MPNADNLIPYRFKPGQSGNPKGRPKNRVPDQLVVIFGSKAKARKFYGLSGEEIDDWEEAVLSMTTGQLKELAKWDDAPAYPKGLAVAVLTEMRDGKTSTLDKLRDRLEKRRSKKPVSTTADVAGPSPSGTIAITVQQRIEMKRQHIVSILKEQGKYTEELSMQAQIVAQLLVRTDDLAAEIFDGRHHAVNVEISREGNERESISPKEKLYMDYIQQSQRALRALGMNTDAKERKTDSDAFSDFLNEFREGEAQEIGEKTV